MERLGLKIDGRRKIQNYEVVKDALTQGLAFEVVAGKFHISKERVRHLAMKWGIKRPSDREMDDSLIVDRYVNQLQSAEKIHEELGYGLMRVRRRLKELGVARTMAETKRARTDNKGRLSDQGYLKVKIPEGHVTRHRKNGTSDYAFVHIIEMEKRLGRPLAKNEIVHHIDLDKTNCNVENLYLCSDHREHLLIHRSLDVVGRELLEMGLISFDGTRYVINEEKLKEFLELREPSFIPDPTPRI